MSSGEFYNIVKLVPKPGKFDELAAAFQTLCKHVEATEPKTQIYFSVRPHKTDEMIIVEKYTDTENLKAHGSTPEFKAFGRAIGPLLAAPPQMQRGDYVAGFEGRSKL
ncbi:hypothetical protein FE257_000757 [Aspergillus nanangensis]|uniref:ABM domain-containing protein n=1 Tax=Aspergillus nanangensis TaxID=2582783 RepID=A0AAD4GQ36_ASPNN|nr:hypothetical protein FE257_000757 [Aspergillus nanangensis]